MSWTTLICGHSNSALALQQFVSMLRSSPTNALSPPSLKPALSSLPFHSDSNSIPSLSNFHSPPNPFPPPVSSISTQEQSSLVTHARRSTKFPIKTRFVIRRSLLGWLRTRNHLTLCLTLLTCGSQVFRRTSIACREPYARLLSLLHWSNAG